jgi:hypothetical protein
LLEIHLGYTLSVDGFSLDRWDYLSIEWEKLRLETVMENPGFETYVEEPEKGRPPFDHVPYSFSVETNAFGFRDREFEEEDRPVWVLLGDSVSFGKGGSVEERYSNILEQDLNIRIYNLALQGCTSECMAILWRNYDRLLDVDGIIIQGSGNDIDQAGWKHAISSSSLSFSHRALWWVSYSVLLQKMMFFRNPQRLEEQLAHHVTLAQKTYRDDLEEVLSLAEKRELPVLFVHLPYAYGYFYAEHLSEICAQYEKCTEVRPSFSISKQRQGEIHRMSSMNVDHTSFVVRTKEAFPFSTEELNSIFPLKNYFHDVVHLNPIGHEAVAKSIGVVLKQYE